MKPEAAMRLALARARASRGRTHPNPPVGAVVFRGDRVLGRGGTQPPGGAHAEVIAIEAALRRHGARAVRGASLAVTLEPCCFAGRTGPCTERILAAGIARVWIGHLDPHPRVSGRGARRLRRAEVRVESAVLETACREQHRGFLSVVARGRPFVVLKLAATLDGRIATRTGESRWITGPAARALVHRMRARSDAIWVGVGTALADDPSLTVRSERRALHQPVRVVSDGSLRLPARSRMLRSAGGETWVLCSRKAPAARRRTLERAGARLIQVPIHAGRQRHLDPRRSLEQLAGAGLTEVLVEGGGQLAASLLRGGLVDEMHWFLAPKLIGGDGAAALGPLRLRRLADTCELEAVHTRRVGDDLHVWGRVKGAS